MYHNKAGLCNKKTTICDEKKKDKVSSQLSSSETKFHRATPK